MGSILAGHTRMHFTMSHPDHVDQPSSPNKGGHDKAHIPLGTSHVPLLSRPDTRLNFAKLHHSPPPQPSDPDYSHYLAKRERAFESAVKSLEAQLSLRCPVSHIQLGSGRLTFRFHSQSKLSQQELIDLQAATHFDKKELQQWYKGKDTNF